ncbi:MULTISPECIES: nitroreductase family protein [Parabacteroides]|uniref:nitroreductase family protein n=1 Tax=Parabacteroides leei TaxID=2939491 RepID=UPI00189A3042|nr:MULTISPECIES: nitroreductase family protein [Parabacteroides]MCL3854086.1 nitroreductase family protein [Parabacteroides leei]
MNTIKSDFESMIGVILNRKSVRQYTEQSVSREQLEVLVKAAMTAPSAVNKQPWAFVVIDDRDTLDNLASLLPYAKMAAKASAAIVVCGDLSKAYHGLDDEYWIQDCSAATENLLLAAEAMGLGGVWTAVYPEEDRIAIVRKRLALPGHIIPLNFIPVGYPLHKDTPKDKYKPENIHFNRW